MRNPSIYIILSTIAILGCVAQTSVIAQPGAQSQQQPSSLQFATMQTGAADESASAGGPSNNLPDRTRATLRGAGGSNFTYYLSETYLNAGFFTAPAFRASLRMANPPGKGLTRYPNDWRQGAEGFGRNYGDAFASRISSHTAQFLTASVTRESLQYMPSGSHNFFARTSHALAFTFVDKSQSGRCMPALSNFAGAAAGGFVGNAYLPNGFTDLTHAGQRAEFQLGMFAAGNLFREFAPQIPGPIRQFLLLIAR